MATPSHPKKDLLAIHQNRKTPNPPFKKTHIYSGLRVDGTETKQEVVYFYPPMCLRHQLPVPNL